MINVIKIRKINQFYKNYYKKTFTRLARNGKVKKNKFSKENMKYKCLLGCANMTHMCHFSFELSFIADKKVFNFILKKVEGEITTRSIF